MAREDTFYDDLMVARTASPEVIRAAYKALSQRYHPDRNPRNEEAARLMVRVNIAYETLSDPIRRRAYDASLVAIETAETPAFDAAYRTTPARSAESDPVETHRRPDFVGPKERLNPRTAQGRSGGFLEAGALLICTVLVVLIVFGKFLSSGATGPGPARPTTPDSVRADHPSSVASESGSSFISFLAVRYEHGLVKYFLGGPYPGKSTCDKLGQAVWDNVVATCGTCKRELQACFQESAVSDVYLRAFRNEVIPIPYVTGIPNARVIFAGLDRENVIRECRHTASQFRASGYASAACVH